MEAVSLGILLCSIAFAIVVIYLSFMLKRVADVTRTLGTSVKFAEQQILEVLPELHQTLRETRVTVDELETHVHTADQLVDTVHNAGKSMQHLNEAYSQYRQSVSEESFQNQIKSVIEGIKWGEAVNQVVTKKQSN